MKNELRGLALLGLLLLVSYVIGSGILEIFKAICEGLHL